ncbi:D-serine ammonia-lyase [Heyndrickxia oleronia]|uniref:D-serine ammonia-lyase n=1 Tax=Heyndrickxia oleronia TaxID=38875 RepID=UPI00203A6A21|nr:D-serine ammonia-lyase [Heyndrickxia oleronia]
MSSNLIAGKDVQQWKDDYPLLEKISRLEEVFWRNIDYGTKKEMEYLSSKDITDALERLERFAPFIETMFPETLHTKGIIESPLKKINKMKNQLKHVYKIDISGELLLKCDSHLPISGSIKARGGIYEVLKHAEDLALENGLLTNTESYTIFSSARFKELFSKYKIAVGSTGNLGLSIGIIGASLGFQVTVHMSSDAMTWKKNLLRRKGVTVIEYQTDYSHAVEAGRRQAETDPTCYFIDDENSKDLFLGYATAASRLKEQFKKRNIIVDEDHPLFVYLPCGVGGGPGGITYGLKTEFGENVHCFFAEPTHSPCFLIGQMTGLHDRVSVFDFGLDNRTAADGLAVGRPSSFVGQTIGHLLSGCYTINDQRLFSFLRKLVDTENLFLEPSALAGFYGPIQLFRTIEGKKYLDCHQLNDKVSNALHLVWATGGSMVPKEMVSEYYEEKIEE